ncbi:MAG: hypothetical protein FJW31_23275 [Acidobacteria bacterium]|nr:hypothetical protein [Acidobacteriota bacterium]
MLPDSLFADVPDLQQPQPEVTRPESTPLAAAAAAPSVPPPPVTVVLRLEDAAFAQPERSLGVLPRTGRAWDDLRVLIGVASAMLNAESLEAAEQSILRTALAATPAGIVVLRRTQNGVTSSTASVREGHSSQLSATAVDLAKRAAAEHQSLLLLGETTVVAAPLMATGSTEPIGALVLESATGPRLGKHDLQLLTGIAALAAPALLTQLKLRG